MADRARLCVADKDAFKSKLYAHKFHDVLPRLLSNKTLSPQVRHCLSEEYLAGLMYLVHKFMEDVCGRQAARPRPITKIPCHLLRDFAPAGAVEIILSTLCEEASFMAIQPAEIFTVTNSVGPLFIKIESALIQVHIDIV
jgi:hypothetical protein